MSVNFPLFQISGYAVQHSFGAVASLDTVGLSLDTKRKSVCVGGRGRGLFVILTFI